RLPDGQLVVSSKGLASKQLALVDETGGNGEPANVYHRIARRFEVADKLAVLADVYPDQTGTLFGETRGAQALMERLQKAQRDFGAFDVRVGDRYLDYDEFVDACALMDVPTVPLLYRGPYDRAKLEEVATGREQLTGREANIREGVVVR